MQAVARHRGQFCGTAVPWTADGGDSSAACISTSIFQDPCTLSTGDGAFGATTKQHQSFPILMIPQPLRHALLACHNAQGGGVPPRCAATICSALRQHRGCNSSPPPAPAPAPDRFEPAAAASAQSTGAIVGRRSRWVSTTVSRGAAEHHREDPTAPRRLLRRKSQHSTGGCRQ